MCRLVYRNPAIKALLVPNLSRAVRAIEKNEAGDVLDFEGMDWRDKQAFEKKVKKLHQKALGRIQKNLLSFPDSLDMKGARNVAKAYGGDDKVMGLAFADAFYGKLVGLHRPDISLPEADRKMWKDLQTFSALVRATYVDALRKSDAILPGDKMRIRGKMYDVEGYVSVPSHMRSDQTNATGVVYYAGGKTIRIPHTGVLLIKRGGGSKPAYTMPPLRTYIEKLARDFQADPEMMESYHDDDNEDIMGWVKGQIRGEVARQVEAGALPTHARKHYDYEAIFTGLINQVSKKIPRRSPQDRWFPDYTRAVYNELGFMSTSRDRRLIKADVKELDHHLASTAYGGISHSPAPRGARDAADYVRSVVALHDTIEPWVQKGQEAEAREDLEKYKKLYKTLLEAFWNAHSSVSSTLIAGPAKFNTRRNKKLSASADKRREEFLNKTEAYRERMRQKWDLDYKQKIVDAAPISSDDADAIERLEAKIAKAQKSQEEMKAINRIAKSKAKKYKSKEDKIKAIMALGHSRQLAEGAMMPDTFGNIGYAPYTLSNNNANIKRMQQRVAELKKRRREETKTLFFRGGSITDSVEGNRVMVKFTGQRLTKSDWNRRASKAKDLGFVWSRQNQAFQRKRGPVAVNRAKEFAISQLGKLEGQMTTVGTPGDRDEYDSPTAVIHISFKGGEILKYPSDGLIRVTPDKIRDDLKIRKAWGPRAESLGFKYDRRKGSFVRKDGPGAVEAAKALVKAQVGKDAFKR